MIINDENPEATGQGKETCVVLGKSFRGTWFVWEVDEGFKSQAKTPKKGSIYKPWKLKRVIQLC